MKANFCTYCILKYMHSPYLDESINIGVLIYFAKSERFVFKYSKSLSRIKSIYNNIPEKTIQEYIRQIDEKLTKISSHEVSDISIEANDLKSFLSKYILSSDSTVLQFSNFKTIEDVKFEEDVVEKIIVEQLFIDDILHPVN